MDADPDQGGMEESESKDKVQTLKDQVEGVKNIMIKNMNQMVDREEKLDVLRDKSVKLEEGAREFKETGTKVARAYWWKNVKMIVVIVVIVLIIVLIIILLATGVIPVSAPVVPVNPTTKP